MRRALALAARGRYRTAPNPLVGAVLVRDGARVGEGFHRQVGGDVACAAEEGGIMRIGAKTVSEPEVKLLVEIAEALRYSPYTPPEVQ